MSEAMKVTGAAPLKLEAAWRIPEKEGATVHPLRVISGALRSPDYVHRDEVRALVADVLREELRSDLGRRMTVSIRRLVQEEVGRLFARFAAR